MIITHDDENVVVNDTEKSNNASGSSGLQDKQKKKPSNLANIALKCDICGKDFKRKDHLKDHIKSQHSGKKEKYTCPLCSRKIGYPQNWKIHMVRTHKWSKKATDEKWRELKQEEELATPKKKIKSNIALGKNTNRGGHLQNFGMTLRRKRGMNCKIFIKFSM